MSNQLVLEALNRACSQNVDELKVAEKQLEEWETKPGFYSALIQIVNDYSLDTAVRWMAVITLKKGIDLYWRKTAPNAMNVEEKKEIRNALLKTCYEPVNQVAVQIAVNISKAARFDFPNEWPELIPVLIDIILKGENPGVQNRALLSLHHVIKTLSSKRLANDRRIFHELTTQLYSFMLNFHNSALEAFFIQVQNKDPQCQSMLNNVSFSLKIQTNLTIHGFNQPRDSPEAIQFVSSVFERIKPLLHLRKTLESDCPILQLLEKVISNLMEVLLLLLDNYPLSFIPFIHPSLSLAVALLFSPEGDGLLFPRLTYLCFKLIHNIILCLEYKFTPNRDEPMSAAPEAVQAYQIRADFFRPELVTDICVKIVTHYMKLSPQELELWDTEPEEFMNSDRDTQMRSCVEFLFSSLFRAHRDVLAPIMVELVRANYQPVSPHDLDAVLKKDSVYLSVGLAAFDLYEEIDMNSWFEVLQQEMTIREGHYRIIRRRAVWLLGQWSGVRFAQGLRPALYRSVIPLLERNEDIVVKFAAASAIREVVDDFVFDLAEFMEYAETIMSRLFDLLKDCQDDDLMIRLLYVFSSIIERVGAAIQPYSSALFHLLPSLWENSENNHILRSSLLNIIFLFAKVLIMDELYPFFYGILDYCVDLEQKSHAYLLDDGLFVWLCVLENTAHLNNALLELLKRMPPILVNYSENYRLCCEILEAYIMLAPKEVLGKFGDEIFSCLYDQINDLKLEGIVQMYQVVAKSLLVDPGVTIEKAMPLISHAFLTIYSGSSSAMIIAEVLTITSRVILHSLETFGQIIEGVSLIKGVDAESFLDQMLLTFTERMGLVTLDLKRKLLAIALTTLLSVNTPAVLNRMAAILDKIFEAFYDVVEIKDTDVVDVLLVLRGSEEEVDEETASDRLLKEFSKKDIVYNVHIGQFIKSQMDELGKRLEPNVIERVMASLKKDTVEGLRLIQIGNFSPV